MQKTDHSNLVFNLAADLVNHTYRHVFITGKAGTGKTTFLKYIREQTTKNAVVVAPTGVAAINAGGVTMHSFFQLPFGPFAPVASAPREGIVVTDKHSLFRNIHFTAAKRTLLQELELLIIDEVSMVRCDMLDAMDTILRHFRRQPLLPFGGVQVVYIGDMFQLPPVIPQQEWSVLQGYYETPFFFSARAVKEAPPLYIELKKIYRQNEQRFIDILNRIRNNNPEAQDLAVLNNRFQPGFTPPPQEHFITLTTHNRKADTINETRLQQLAGKPHRYKAELQGEFSDKALPTEEELVLKEGAQVMFVKNDTGADRRYFNGKLARIKSLSAEQITVSFFNGDADLALEKETWKNIRYNYNRETDDIDEEELGSFKQYPIRLAWAITIHKSQGLTFDRAVIDAGASFAAGQVYVALSRCTSLDGLVLHSRIPPSAIATDDRILEFAKREENDQYLEELLKTEKQAFQVGMLVKAFSWSKVVRAARDWKAGILGKKLPDMDDTVALCNSVLSAAVQQQSVAEKFQAQLQQLLAQDNPVLLQERVSKAVAYFSNALYGEVLYPLQQHLAALQYASKVKKYYAEVRELEGVFIQHLQRLNALQYGEIRFQHSGIEVAPHRAVVKAAKKPKPEKGASFKDTLLLFREGKSLAEIARLRNLTLGTIESHLAGFVFTGEVTISELVSPEKTEAILKAIDKVGMNATIIKSSLDVDCSYGEIRAVMNYHRLLEERSRETA